MLAEYAGVLVLLLVALLATGGLLAVASRLGPRRPLAEKSEPGASGEAPTPGPRRRPSLRFQLVALLFLIFNVEAAFLYPWAATFREVGLPGLVAVAVFALPLGVGLVYEWSKGALEW